MAEHPPPQDHHLDGFDMESFLADVDPANAAELGFSEESINEWCMKLLDNSPPPPPDALPPPALPPTDMLPVPPPLPKMESFSADAKAADLGFFEESVSKWRMKLFDNSPPSLTDTLTQAPLLPTEMLPPPPLPLAYTLPSLPPTPTYALPPPPLPGLYLGNFNLGDEGCSCGFYEEPTPTETPGLEEYSSLVEFMPILADVTLPVPLHALPPTDNMLPAPPEFLPTTPDVGRCPPRTKGNRWTREEHELFLMGLKKHGRGKWKNITKDYVKTKTPLQIASHAQKYFLHQEKKNSADTTSTKKRKSIHDKTTDHIPDP